MRESITEEVPTLADVARAAGVSIATASRTLSNSAHRVNEATRTRVQAAADELGYSPNRSAREVSQGRSASVALVVSDLTNATVSAIATGVVAAADAARLRVTIAAAEPHHHLDAATVGTLRGLRPSLAVVVGDRVSDPDVEDALLQELKLFESDGCRVVLVGEAGLPFDTVAYDHTADAVDLAAQVVGLGYRKFAILAGSRRSRRAGQRLAGFRSVLAEAGLDLPESAVLHGPSDRDGGYAAAGELLNRYLGVEAVLSVDDSLAIGALVRFREAGVAIPGTLALAGFGGIADLRNLQPLLTTVDLPTPEMGRQAVALALRPLAREPRTVLVRGEVLLRASTPPR